MPELAPDGFPIPPPRLITRAGATPGSDAVAEYLAGAGIKQHLMGLLAEHGSGDLAAAPRVLDFGCGAGNVVRHFGDEARAGEVWGADIDTDSIGWLERHLTPPFQFCALSSEPGLPFDDDHFDLIYAISVFTHLAQDWAAWLLELRRVLAPGGVLMVTILGEGMAEAERAGPWDEDRVGMNVLRPGQDWAGGGPTVFLSDWWIRAHWGRALEILDIHHDRTADGAIAPNTHGYVVARKRPGTVTAADLEALDPGEPREIAALQHNLGQLHADDRELRELLAAQVRRGNAEHDRRVAAEARVAELNAIAGSRSWRMTKRLRVIAERTRR